MAKKEKEALDEREEMNDADSAEARMYELGFHIDPELGAEEVKKEYEAVKAHVTAAGSVVAEGEPEKIPLAYTISRMETGGRRDFDTAYFAWIAYEADGEGHQAVVRAAGENKRIIRFIDLRTTKEQAQHSVEMREFYAQAAERQSAEEEEVSDVELDAALKEAGVS